MLENLQLAFSENGKTLAVAGAGGVVYFIDLVTGARIDGDVFPARVWAIEPWREGFVVFHQDRAKTHRSYIGPGGPRSPRPDLVLRAHGETTVADAETVIVHDPELGVRLVVESREHLLLPGIRGGGGEFLVDAQGFRLSRNRRRLAFARVACTQKGCQSTLRVTQCAGLP